MRKRIWISCIAVLAVCLALLFKAKQHHETVMPGPTETITNLPMQVTQSPAASSHQNPSSPTSSPTFINNAVGSATAVGESNAIDPRLLAHWQAPIDFYGKVVDENSNAIAGVNIHFRWSEKPAEDGMRTADTQSDTEGLFSLNGKRGASLTVWFGKDGYYSSGRGEMSFSYALPRGISPDPQNPVIFHLHKKGHGESLVGLKRNYRIPRDGTPVSIDLTTGATATSESGNVVVRCWTQDAGKRSGEKYDWRCVVGIPGGGAVTNNEEFTFEAPEEGYVPSLEIAMPADRPDWQDDVDLKFYYRLADGRYGRMTFSMIAGGQHFCMIDSVLNPSGSRNLEPQ